MRLPNVSGLSREAPAPFCEGLTGKFRGSTHQYHRAIKQVCNIESFQVGGKTAVKNHLFAAICGYVELQRLKAVDIISNCYKLRRELFNEIISSFIEVFAQGKDHLNPKFSGVVNA